MIYPLSDHGVILMTKSFTISDLQALTVNAKGIWLLYLELEKKLLKNRENNTNYPGTHSMLEDYLLIILYLL